MGILGKFGDSLKDSLRKLVRATLVDRKLIDELILDIKRSLVASDVSVELSQQICDQIQNRATTEKPPAGITEREHVINIVYAELVKFLGADTGKVEIKEKPTRILLCGLFGSGKTTTAAKLAKIYKKQGLKVALVQTDTWRPAAYEQLKQLSDKVRVFFFGDNKEKNPIKIIQKYKDELNKFNVVIFDTAGRDALNNELIDEIEKVKAEVQPHEAILVLSGDIGQAAQEQANAFQKSVGITGVIITKLDGTAKGGGALTACAATNAKVKFIGVGEHVVDLEEYKPKNFVSRLLGMGDLESLLKKAEGAIKKEDAEKMNKKLAKGDFSLNDLYQQMEAMKKMGPLNQIANMIPGMGAANIPNGLLNKQEGKMKSWKFLMDSMTPEEKEHPELINAPRITRIAKGSGRPEQEVRELLKQYKQMKKVMKMVGSPEKMKNVAKMFKGKLPKGFKMPF